MSNSQTSKSARVLLADIGGTNARFALMKGGEIGVIEHLKVADFPTMTDAVAIFLRRRNQLHAVQAAVLGVAGPISSFRPPQSIVG